MTIKKGEKLLLLATYCDGDYGEKCSEELPCSYCLAMCNVIELKEDVEVEVIGGIDYLRGLEKKRETKSSTMPANYTSADFEVGK